MKKHLFLLPALVIGAASMAGCGKTMTPQEKIDAAIDQALEMPSDVFAVSPVLANAITSDAKTSMEQLKQTVSNVAIIEDMSTMYPNGYRDLRVVNKMHQQITTSIYKNGCETIDTNGYVHMAEGTYSTNVNYTRNDTIFVSGYNTGNGNDRAYDIFDNVNFDYEGRTGVDLVKQIPLGGYVDPLGNDTQENYHPLCDLPSLEIARKEIINYFKMSEKYKLGANGDSSDNDYLYMDSSKTNAYIVRTLVGATTLYPSPIDFTKTIPVRETEKYVIHFINVENVWRVDSYAYTSSSEADSDFCGNPLKTPAVISCEKYVTQAVYGIMADFEDVGRYFVDERAVSDKITLKACYQDSGIPVDEDRFNFGYATFNDMSLYNKAIDPSSTDFVFTGGTSYKSGLSPEARYKEEDEYKTIGGMDPYEVDDPLQWVYTIYPDEFASNFFENAISSSPIAGMSSIAQEVTFLSSGLYLPANFDFSFSVVSSYTDKKGEINYKNFDKVDPLGLVEEGKNNTFHVKQTGYYAVTISYSENRDYGKAVLSIRYTPSTPSSSKEDKIFFGKLPSSHYDNFKFTENDRWTVYWENGGAGRESEEELTYDREYLPGDYGDYKCDYKFSLKTDYSDCFIPTKVNKDSNGNLVSGIEFTFPGGWKEKPDAYALANTSYRDGYYQTDITVSPYYYDEYNKQTVYYDNQNIDIAFKDASIKNYGEIIGIDESNLSPFSGYHIDHADGKTKTFDSSKDYKSDNAFVIYKDGEKATDLSDIDIYVYFNAVDGGYIDYTPLSVLNERLTATSKNFITIDNNGILQYDHTKAVSAFNELSEEKFANPTNSVQVNIGVGGIPSMHHVFFK